MAPCARGSLICGRAWRSAPRRRPRRPPAGSFPTARRSHSSSRRFRSSCSHGPAGGSAELAGLRATLAVVHLMFCAFGSTGFAGCGAEGADRLDVFPAPADGRRRETAYIGTFQIQRDAPDHRFWVCLLQACACTLEAGSRAIIARTKAIDFLLTGHL